jgi:diguanylate cyclase (GGDEF)-like protein
MIASNYSAEPGSRLVARVQLILANARETVPQNTTEATPSLNGSYGAEPPAVSLGKADNLSVQSQADSTSQEAADTTPSHPLYNLLTSAGHIVTWSMGNDWRFEIDAEHGFTRPQVIIVEASSPSDECLQLFRELRDSSIGRNATLLAILPVGRKNDKSRMNFVQALQDAGADDFFVSNAGTVEILARVRAGTVLCGLRTDMEATRESLRLQVQLDDQTKLLNRRFFFQAAHRECGRARRYNSELSCLMFEIDHFKRLLVTLGYECGDVMLRTVASVLRDYTRDSDIVARFDEEKFVVMLPETSIEGATMLREKIQGAIAERQPLWNNVPLPLSISAGEANRNRDVAAPVEKLDIENTEAYEQVLGVPLSTREELAELLAAADAALFVAKRGVRFPALDTEAFSKAQTDDNDGDSLQQLPSMD